MPGRRGKLRALIDTKLAICLLLLRGPSYGKKMHEDVERLTRGRMALPSTSRAIQELRRQGLVRTSNAPHHGEGQPPQFVELTDKGAELARADHAAILAILTGSRA
jgi:DNA-binding PadR family transcriptional regulator